MKRAVSPWSVFAVAAGLTVILAAVALPPAVRGQSDVRPLIENERVTVWDIAAGGTLPSVTPARDMVVLSIHGKDADVNFRPKGTAKSDGQHARTILIALQDKIVAPLANTSGYADAFPRPGSKRVLDNARVVAWDYTWTPGQPRPMHFHDKDVVVTYLADGELTSTDPKGASVVNPHSFGFTKFNTRDRVHTETLTKGQGRAIIVELK
jgi:hypothetical protein